MKIRDFQLTDLRDALPRLNGFVRDVIAVLNGKATWSDQMESGLISAVYNSTDLPVFVDTRRVTPPKGVWLVSAKEPSSGTILSGLAVTWTWAATGELRIDAVSGLASSTRYELLLAVVS